MPDAQHGGSQADYPARGVSTVYVAGWPGESRKAEHDDPGALIVAYTEAAQQRLDFQSVGVGNVLKLNAQNEHAPGANLLLTVSVPRGSDIVVQKRG